MARIPAISRLAEEDFPQQKDWINKLLGPMNSFLGAVSFALNKGLNFTDNFQGQEANLDFTYSNSSSLPSFKWNLSSLPLSLEVCSATEDSSPIALMIAWQYTQQGMVQITDCSRVQSGTVSNLRLGSRYKVRVRVTP